MAPLRKIRVPLGIFLEYCVIKIRVPLSYEYDKTNYPNNDEEIVNCTPIVTSVAMGIYMDNTKDGPFHNNFSVDMTFLWYILHHFFGGTKFWFHDKPSSNIKNGKYVLFLLKNLLLGSKYVTHMAAQLYLKLSSFSYDG